MTRLYVEAPLAPGTRLTLPPQPAAHLAKVLRARSGDALTLFDGGGGEFTALVQSVRGAEVTVAVGQEVPAGVASAFTITLLQSVPRGERMDFIVQKATELGVTRIVPLLTQHSVVRLNQAQALAKQQHWRAVAIGACEQCGRTRLPEVSTPQPLLTFLGSGLGEGARWVLQPPAPLAACHPLTPGAALGHAQIAIGPEGGFSPAELDAFRLAGFSSLALGPRILRTETAALAAVAWLQLTFGDMSAKSHGGSP